MSNNASVSLIFVGLLLCSNAFSQEDDLMENYAEDHQVLESPSTAQPLRTRQTERVSDSDIDSMARNSEEMTNQEMSPPSGVVSESDLLKTKKQPSKVRAQKTTETNIYVGVADKYKLEDKHKNIKLNDIIEQGLRQNYEQNISNLKIELNEVQFSGTKNAFWLPHLQLNLTTQNHNLATLSESTRQPLNPNSKSPTGTLGLSFGEYNVFNWGKDYARYLNEKTLYERKKQINSEEKRELKLELIEKYFALLSTRNIEKIRQEQLRRSSFLYRLNKEKITVGKISKQDYYQARSEYLKTQNEFHNSRIESDIADESLALLVADPIGTKYVITEELEFKKINITLDELLSLAEKNNPQILTSKMLIANAQRDYDIAVKENMPLPKFSVNLGAYNKRFGPGIDSTRYETYSNSGNVELVASINTTWDLTGKDGLFNSNKLAQSRITKEIAARELDKSAHSTQSLIRQTYKTVLSLQNQILILEARIPSLQKTFDTILDNYLNSRNKFYDFSIALDDLTYTRIYFEQIKLEHLKQKVFLAKLAGIEDFPGENFEHLAIRAKGK